MQKHQKPCSNAELSGTDLAPDLRQVVQQMGYMPEGDFQRLAGITPSTAEGWRKRGDGPAWVRLGNAVYYPVEGVSSFLKARIREPRRVAVKDAL